MNYIKAVVKKIKKRKSSDNKIIQERYFEEDKIKLNIGGGKGHPNLLGWKVVDLRDSAGIILDISKEPLPFQDNSVDIIYTSHTLEHIYVQDLPFVLSEFYRVLKPKIGLLRIVIPDINKACKAYVNGDFKFFKESTLTVYDEKAPIGGYLMSWFYSISSVGNGHVHCFDYDYLKYLLNKANFKKVVQSDYKKSSLEELRLDGFDISRHQYDSIYVECYK